MKIQNVLVLCAALTLSACTGSWFGDADNDAPGLSVRALASGPPPVLSVSATASPLVGENVTLTLTLDNGDANTDTGYFPTFRFVLPPQLTYASVDNCNGVGTPTVTAQANPNPTNPTTRTDPYTGEVISLAGGEDLIVVRPNTGQITPLQPPVVCRFTLTASGQTPFVGNIIHDIRGIFVLGGYPNGTPSACGGSGDTNCSVAQTSTITPTLLKLTKSSGHASPFGTGPTYPVTFTISGDLAAGQTLTNVTITDTIQDEFVKNPADPGDCSTFAISPAPTTCTFTPDATAFSGGQIFLTYTTLAADFSIAYAGYVRDLKDDAAAIVNPVTGNSTSSVNSVSVSATELASPVTASATLSHHSVNVTKGVSNTNDIGGAGNTPGDELTWTIRVALSDYFQIENITFADTVGDGLDYTAGSLNVALVEGGTTTNFTEAALGANYVVTPNGNGTTSLALNLGAAMTAALGDDILSGDGTAGSGTSTTLVLSYKTTIRNSYTTDPGSGDLSIDSGDTLLNSLNAMTFDIVGGNAGVTRSASASATIAPIAFTKVITHVNGVPVAPGTVHVEAGDTVTFRVAATIPGGDAEQLEISDYLPRPLFSSSPCPTNSAVVPPAVDNWSFGTNTTGVAAGSVTVTCSGTDNRIRYTFPNFDNAGGGNAIAEIYFTTTVLPEPFANGLLQVNLAQLTYNNSTGSATATAIGSINFVGDAPDLTVTKSATATTDAGATIASGNVTNIDAGGVITYQVTLTNADGGTAYDVTVRDPLPTGMEPPAGAGACSGAACGYDITTDAGCTDGGSGTPDPDTETNETQVKLLDLQIAPLATCVITYKYKVAPSAQFGVVITNTATVSWASTIGGTTFSPKTETATATIARPTLTKAASVLNGAPPDVVTFSIAVTIPEGTGNSFSVLDIEQNDFWGNPTAVVVTGGISGSGPYCSTDHPNICFTNDPTNSVTSWNSGNATAFSINLGTVTNTYTDDTNRTVTFQITGPVKAVTSGDRTNRGRVTWNNGSVQTVNSTNTITFTVRTPKLVVTECVDPVTTAALPLSLADTAGYIVQVKNTGTAAQLAHAYDIAALAHVLPMGINYGGGTVTAYHCTTGASATSCSGWTPANCTGTSTGITATVRAGEAVEPPNFGGNSRQEISFPVVNGSGASTLLTDEYVTYLFTTDISCENAADTSGPDATAGVHPDNDGIANGCSLPVAPYSGTLDTASSVASYSSQNGVVAGEGTYGPANSNTVSVNLDHDGDGIANASETSGDADGDGVPNYLDTDSDDNGWSDSGEGALDVDGDGSPDYKDLDDDNDGLQDGAEIASSGGNLIDTDGDGTPNYRDPDADGDGIGDASEGTAVTDTDNDGLADYLDLDSDSDGIPDMIEQGLGAYDSDGNGILTNAEILASGLDANGDHAISAAELGGSLPDADGDGVANFRDLDSDQDGLSDTDEAGLAAFTGANHLVSTAEYVLIDDGAGSDLTGGAFDDNSVVNVDEIPDTDGDGIWDFLDTDSDNDGLPDIVENRRYVCDANGNGKIDYNGEVDTCVGINDTGDHLIQNSEFTVFDHDGDGTPDYQDRDSDGDGIGDLIEAYAIDRDGNANGFISPAEYAAATAAIGDNDGTLEYGELVDTDNDGTYDVYDTDTDGDTILDTQESGPAPVVYTYAGLYSTDGDGVPDFRDLDSDGDGYLDSVEAGDASTLTAPFDTDSDGTPDCRDLDSDGDDLNDAGELALSSNRTVEDSDGDGCEDGCEVFGNTAGCPFNDPLNLWYPGAGSVGSPLTLPTDADTDDGGTNDCAEATGVPPTPHTDPRLGHGADDSYHTEDPDNDGLTNDEEATLGTDHNVNDSDGDGCIDGCEVLGTTAGCPFLLTGNDTWKTGPYTIGNPISNPLVGDTDGEGCNDCFEGATLLTNPRDSDTDDDAVTDCREHNLGTDPKNPDSDGDGLPDGQELDLLGTDPLDADSDGDGCGDFAEVETFHSNPLADPDSDGDTLTDCQEDGTYGTDRTKPDTDDGGIDDGKEVNLLHTNPLDATDDCPNPRDTDGDGLTDCEEIAMGTDMNSSDVGLQGSATNGPLGFGCAATGGGTDRGRWMAVILAMAGILFLRRRRNVRPLIVLAVVFLSSSAFALNVQLFRPSPDRTPMVTQPDTEPTRPGTFAPGLFLNYVSNPLEFGITGDDPRIDAVVDWFLTMDALLSVGITPDLSLGIDIPVIFSGGIEPIVSEVRDQHTYLGDPMVNAVWRLRSSRLDGKNRFGFALVPFLTIPISDTDRFFGDESVTAGARLVVDRPIGKRHHVSMNVGFRARERERILNLNVNHEILAGVGYACRLSQEKRIDVYSELYGSTTTREFLSQEVTSPVELVAGLRKSWNDWTLDIGGGRGANNGYGAPDWRVFAGLRYAKTPKPTPTPAPQPTATPAPEPTVVPTPLPAAPAQIAKIDLIGKVLFDTNKATIKPESFPVLDNVVDVMTRHSEIKKVRIEAHTDDRAPDSYNLSLSDRRAASVRKYLEGKGIDPARLESQGFGETRPIDTNATRLGRAQNRRVEFVILDPATPI